MRRYREGLSDWAAERGVRLAPELPERGPNHHIFYLLYPEARLRDAALRALREQGILATFHYVPLHSAPHARKLGLDVELPVTDRVASTLLRLPLHPRLDRGRGRTGRRRRARDGVPRVSGGGPYLSLVLACYNEAEHLLASFAEIRETLEQSGRPFEVIFVDDVSRDRTRAILQEIVAAHPRPGPPRDPPRHEPGPRGHRHRRLPRRAGRDRRLPRRGPRGALPVRPVARAARSRRAPTSPRSGASTPSSCSRSTGTS